MGILSGEQREILAEFHNELFDEGREIYVRDFFPPDDDDDGVPIDAPDPNPSMPELKYLNDDEATPFSDEAWEVAGRFGAFAFATMRHSHSDREVALT